MLRVGSGLLWACTAIPAQSAAEGWLGAWVVQHMLTGLCVLGGMGVGGSGPSDTHEGEPLVCLQL